MAEVADWISAGAAVVAAIAAVAALGFSLHASGSAKASANAAKEANRIQLHAYRKTLYLAFQNLYSHVCIGGYYLKDEEVFPFNEQALTSELYVSDELADRVANFYSQSRKLAAHVSQRNHAMKTLEDLNDLDDSDIDRSNYLEDFKQQDEAVSNLHQHLAVVGRHIQDELKELSRIKHD